TPGRLKFSIRSSSQTTSTITKFFHGPSVSASRFICLAGNFLRPRADLPPVISRRVVDLDRARRDLHHRHNRRKSPRPRYHLRLLWSRQSKLELPRPSRARSCFTRGCDFVVLCNGREAA